MANRGIMQVLNLCLTYLFVVAGFILLLFPGDITGTDLGRFTLFAMAGFWLMRALLQPIFFGWKHWLSIVLFGIFILGTLIHGYAWWSVRDI
jgi:hypothetical protein